MKTTESIKILLDGDYRAIAKGRFVTAKEDEGEFILTEKEGVGLTLIQMHEYARANAIKLVSKNKRMALRELLHKLNDLRIPNMSEKTDAQKVLEIVQKGHEEGKSEDDMMLEIVKSGIKFTVAARHFKDAQRELGLAVSPKQRYERAREMMVKEKFVPDTYDQVDQMAEKIAEEIPSTSHRQAISQIKKYLKEVDLEMPSQPRGVRGNQASVNALADYLASKPDVSKEEFINHWVKVKGEERGRRYAERRLWVLDLVRKLQKKHEKELQAA